MGAVELDLRVAVLPKSASWSVMLSDVDPVPAVRMNRIRTGISDLGAAPGAEGGVLPDTIRMENIYPEYRIVHAVCDPAQLLPFILRGLKTPCDPHHDLQTQWAQSSFVEP